MNSAASYRLVAVIELVHPWMLVFGLAALIPVLVHYWHRRTYLPVRWAATQYLKMALARVSTRFSILQWLLLILRVMIVLLLALTLANPALRSVSSLFAPATQSSRLRIIVIDTSFSMQAIEQDQSRLSAAKRVAADLLEDLVSRDGAAIYTYDRHLQSVHFQPFLSSQEGVMAVDQVRASQNHGRFSDVLSDLAGIFQWPAYQRFDSVELHLVSDFAQHDGTETAVDRENWERLSSLVDVVKKHPVSRTKLSNYFITRISPVGSIPVVNQDYPVDVEIRNHGGDKSQSLTVEMFVNGKFEFSRVVEVPANDRARVRFALKFEKQGEHLVEVRLGDDCLNLDNRRFLAVECRPVFRVLFLEGREGGSRFLRLALQPEQDKKNRFKIQSCMPEDLDSVDLKQVDVIFWDNVRALDLASIERLKRFVEKGGFLILFLGDLVERNQFNQHWNQPELQLGLKLEEVMPLGGYQVNPLEYQSPFMEAFRGNPQSGLTDLPIWSYYRVSMQDGLHWTTELAFDNGDPLLASRPCGEGAIAVFTTSSSSESKNRDDLNFPRGVSWNVMETLPVFPPLVQEIFFSLIEIPNPSSLLIGDSASGKIEVRSLVRSYEFLSLEGRSDLDVDIRQMDDLVSWRSTPVAQAGFYRFSLRAGNLEMTSTVAANVDISESDLRSSDFRPDSNERNESASLLGGTPRQLKLELFQILLGLLLALLILENFLAYRFGRGYV